MANRTARTFDQRVALLRAQLDKMDAAEEKMNAVVCQNVDTATVGIEAVGSVIEKSPPVHKKTGVQLPPNNPWIEWYRVEALKKAERAHRPWLPLIAVTVTGGTMLTAAVTALAVVLL